jgi:GAF domain-containing protein
MMNVNFKKIISDIDAIIINGETKDDILHKICTLLKERVFHYDWVGFYILEQSTNNLILGPYAGKTTDHTSIPVGKGVCGQVAESKKAKVVQDVSAEDNYISCSIDVQSEIVVPIIKNGLFVAELDIDSNSPAPFTIDDEKFLKKICNKLSEVF